MNFSCKRIFPVLLLMVVNCQLIFATHYRAGEIIYENIGNYRIRATVITYSKYDGISVQADRDTITISWGDGTTSLIARSNGIDADGNGFKDGVIIATNPSIKKNEYVAEHSYPGPPPPPDRYYIISFFDMNRIDGINNIDGGNSINIPFYVEDTVRFPTDLANIGFNSSPELLYPPIDYANCNDTFIHNPLAWDRDGDSLDFQFMICLQDQGTNVPVYMYPDQYCISQGFSPNTFTIDRHTGQVVWATPCRTGIYNIAILITEYRNGVPLGTVIRDMQIIVTCNNNDPPLVTVPKDTCIRAGDSLILQVTARDPQPFQTVTLSADGAPFRVSSSPAAFPTVTGLSPVGSTFQWNTDCSHIQKQNYLVVFRAADNYQIPGNPPVEVPLVDLETLEITVIAPPPAGLTATATNQSVTLNWDNPYVCSSSPDFRGFSIWRKTGCDPFTPDYCETGLAGRGYTKLTGTNIFTYSYNDNTTIVGQQYSYRIVAHFSKLSPNGLFQFGANESVASDEACIYMPVNVPVILNVDVQQTDVTNGQIFIRWAKPLAGGANLDTIQNPPPYRFDLYRSNGSDFNTGTLILSTPDATSYSSITDTFFTDAGIDTRTTPWSYRVYFFSNNDTVGPSAPASSVYLNVLPSDQSLFLTWSENVPWANDSFAVYKFNKVTSLFEAIDTVYNHNFTDLGLTNDSNYCYYIQTYGHYTLDIFPKPLINKSQEDCGIPVDTTAPCPPTLTVRNDCDLYEGKPWNDPQFVNYLKWDIQIDSCSDDITHYFIYFGSDSTNLAFLDSMSTRNDTTFNHTLSQSLDGCYAVTALDRVGNESGFSNIFCVDNCPYYVLPNTFTPNGDGQNDRFHPFKPYRFVPKIEMKIFNRWGAKVFETEDPEINWDGTDLTGKPLNDGVYVYAGYYFEQHQNGLVRRPLSGQKKGGGFIHLIRGK